MYPAFLCTVLFSLSIVSGHRSSRLVGGTEANFWRLTVATLCLGCWAYGFGIGLAGEAFPLFLLSGVVGIGLGDIALFQALPRLGSRLTSLLISCLTAPCGAVMEWWWLGTTLGWKQIACGTITLAGVAVALAPEERRRYTSKELAQGLLFSAVSAVGVGGGAALSRKAYALAHGTHLQIDAITAGFQRVVGGLLLAGICLLVVKRREFRVQARAPAHLILEVSKKKWAGVWFWVLLNGLAGQTLGVSCMQWALETTPSGIVLAIISITPIVVIPLAFFLEGERPTAHAVIGGAVAVGGAAGLALIRN